MEENQNPDEEKSSRPNALGIGIALGAGVGAVLFAFTSNPVWIGVMAGAGVAVGAAFSSESRP